MRVNEIIGDNGGLDDPDMPIIFSIIQRKLDAGEEVWFNDRASVEAEDGRVFGFSFKPRTNNLSNRHWDMHVQLTRADGKLMQHRDTIPVSIEEIQDGTFKKVGNHWLLTLKSYPNGVRNGH